MSALMKGCGCGGFSPTLCTDETNHLIVDGHAAGMKNQHSALVEQDTHASAKDKKAQRIFLGVRAGNNGHPTTIFNQEVANRPPDQMNSVWRSIHVKDW